ncbi:MAG: hypothetical protein H0T51_11915 [Pirellulales bacterium]|nr:hypothetical protein [Pirellulales bacterium]
MRSLSVNSWLYALAAAAGWLAPSLSMAANDVWKTAVNGTWSAGLNWVDGSTPSSIFDQATFNLPGAYTVSFTGDPDPIGALTLTSAANVTFASSSRPGNPIVPRSLSLVETSGANNGNLVVSGGATLTLGATTAGFPSSSHPFHLTAGGNLSVGPTATLNVRFGSDVVASVLSHEGQINVSGSGSSLNVNSMHILGGSLNVTAGGLVQSTSSFVGLDTGGGSVTVSGAGSQWNNSGRLTVGFDEGGSSMLNVTGGGSVSSTDGVIGVANGAGTATVTGGAWTMTGRLSVGGDVSGELSDGTGTLSIQPAGTVSAVQGVVIFLQGLVRLQGGTLDASTVSFDGAGGQFQWASGTLHVGTFNGSLTNSGGTLAPGHSAGSTTINGNYTQVSEGVLEIEIAGPLAGSEFDFVNVTSTAQVNGELDLTLTGGFVPTPSQTFAILISGGLSGAFDNAPSGQRVTTSDGGGSFLVNYGVGSPFDDNHVVLSNFLAGAGQSGDFDVDGDVDGRDFLIWQRGGSPNPLSTGDLALWRADFGAPAVAAGGAVPEPTTLVLICLSAVTIRRSRAPCFR